MKVVQIDTRVTLDEAPESANDWRSLLAKRRATAEPSSFASLSEQEATKRGFQLKENEIRPIAASNASA